MPLKNRLVLVVRVPFTDGEMLPVPLVSTGGRSALTPASDDSRCVKLPVDVGTASSSAPVRLRDVAAVVIVEQSGVGGHLHRLREAADLQRDRQRSRHGSFDGHAASNKLLEAVQLERHFVRCRPAAPEFANRPRRR